MNLKVNDIIVQKGLEDSPGRITHINNDNNTVNILWQGNYYAEPFLQVFPLSEILKLLNQKNSHFYIQEEPNDILKDLL